MKSDYSEQAMRPPGGADFKKYFETLKDGLRRELSERALCRLYSGLRLFHGERAGNEAAVMNGLAAAVEFMLKAFIAGVNPVLLFQNLPPEPKAFFAAPESVPPGFDCSRYESSLKSLSFPTAPFDECVSLFYIFFPERRHEFYPYLRLLSRLRDSGVYAKAPALKRPDLDRAAYAALRLYDLLKSADAFGNAGRALSKEDKAFLSAFETERKDRVRIQLKEAEEKAAALAAAPAGPMPEGHEFYPHDCPACGGTGLFTGYTEAVDAAGKRRLSFYACEFECEKCGLKLEDAEEIRLTGMKNRFDRGEPGR